MVYEDALTILSYASPYPVKVTLQKQPKAPRNNRRLSEVLTNLSHPLYRSQSMDALHTVPKESFKQDKRYNSEMRYDRRDSPKIKRVSKGGHEKDITEEEAVSANGGVLEVSTSKVDAVIHREHTPVRLNLDREQSVAMDTDLPSASIDLNKDQTDGHGNAINQFSSVFEELTEEDKLDMLRLSYADPLAIPDSPFDGTGEQKIVPQKPERKKKRNSSASTPSHSDGEMTAPTTPHREPALHAMEMLPPQETPPPIPPETPPPLPPEPMLDVHEDVFQADVNKAAFLESSPVLGDHSEEVTEIMEVQSKSRRFNIDSGHIAFESVTPSRIHNGDRTLVDDSLLDLSLVDNDKTLVSSPPRAGAESPEGEAIEEEVIAPTQRAAPQFSMPGLNDKRSTDNLTSESNSNVAYHTVDVNTNKNVVKLPELDMNLNFDSPDSVLYKESFPKRNEKEVDNGVAYDISVTELDAMSRKAKAEQRTKSETKGKGGIAFEIRDDVVTGETRTVNSVHRTLSYEITSPSDKFLLDHQISSHRPTSLKDAGKHGNNEGSDTALGWSGQRLVRAGSFTDIPQDDHNDWTNAKNLARDDSQFELQLQQDARSPVFTDMMLTTVTSDPARDKAELSDDSQCRSLSSSAASSEGGNSPRTRLETSTNGEDDGLGLSAGNSPEKFSPMSDLKTDLLATMAKFGESDQGFTVDISSQGDEDC